MIKIQQNEFDKLSVYIKSNYGIDLGKKKNLIEGRLTNTIREKGYGNFGEYLDFVFKDATGKETALLIDKMTTNHTFFMRESGHYEFMEAEVLPWLTSISKDRDMRIWSAGCSSGEEPYTLTMLIKDYLGDKSVLWDSTILATDISESALLTAQKGLYLDQSVKHVSPMWKSRYFKKKGHDTYQICESIKKEVIFRKFNLMNKQFKFKKKFHVIFCRNVMIYFDRKTKLELIERYYDNLEIGGYLFIGHSESISRDETRFKYIKPAIYRKV